MWYSPENFFDLSQLKESRLEGLFEGLDQVWDLLDRLEGFIQSEVQGNVALIRSEGDFLTKAWAVQNGQVFEGVSYELGEAAKGRVKVYQQGRLLEGAALIMPGVMLCGNDIEIGDGALVESGAMIKGPAIIGPRSEVRQGAYLRGGVITSPGSVLGHVTEAKNVLMMNGAKAGHFAYLGDSVLGMNVNLGAGTKLANLKMNNLPYKLGHEGEFFKVERRKFGAIIGDETETGCNTVLNPGTLLGKKTRVLPNSSLAPGYRPGRSFLSR